MNINYVKELGASYMKLASSQAASGYEDRIIKENRIKELLQTHYSQMDGEGAYYYNISELNSLDRKFSSKQMDYESFKGLMLQIAGIPEVLSGYLLNKNHLVLSPETIYFTKEGELRFCYFPEAEADFSDGLMKVLTFVLRKIDHSDEMLTRAAYDVFELASDGNCSLSEIRKIFNEGIALQADQADMDIWDDEEQIEIQDEEDPWEDEPEEELVEKTTRSEQSSRKERIFKIIGIATPILAVVIIGIFLFV